MSNLDQPPGNSLNLENDDVWSHVRPLLVADRSSGRQTSKQPSQALGSDAPVAGKAKGPLTALPPLQIDQSERGQTADAATVLNKLAPNQDFLRTMVRGKPTLTLDDVQHQLDIDRIATANPQSPLKYLTSRDAHDDLQYAQKHWSALPRDSVRLDQLTELSSVNLKHQHVILDTNGNVSHKQSDATTKRLHDTVQRATEPAKPKPPEQDNLDTRSFVGVAERLIEKIDKHGDGKVTKEELQRAMKDPAISGTDAQALAVLYAGFDTLTKISGDKKDGEPCLSLPTMERFEQLRQADINNQAYQNWAYDAFEKYGGKDGEIKREDLEKALKSNPPEPDKTYLQYTLKHFGDFNRPEDGGDPNTIGVGDLWTYFARDQNGSAALSVVQLLVGQTTIDADSSGKLYGKETPEASIRPAAVNQSELLTDCYMLGPLAEMAERNPDALKKMIKQNSDGTYTVTFPGTPDDPITVPAPTEAERRLFNHGGAYGIWANVFEKAFGQMQTDTSLFRRIGEAIGTYKRTPEEVLTELGDPRTTIKLLTGSESDQISFQNQTTGQIKAEIEKALNEHKLFVLSSSLKPADNIHPAHAYTVVAIKPDGHGGEVALMRESSSGGATIEVPLSQIQNSFGYMSTQR